VEAFVTGTTSSTDRKMNNPFNKSQIDSKIEDLAALIAEEIGKKVAEKMGDKLIDILDDHTSLIAEDICGKIKSNIEKKANLNKLSILLEERNNNEQQEHNNGFRKNNILFNVGKRRIPVPKNPDAFTRPHPDFITGEELLSTRTRLGLTQKNFAKKLGLSSQTNVSNVETGRLFISGNMNEVFKVKFPEDYRNYMENSRKEMERKFAENDEDKMEEV